MKSINFQNIFLFSIYTAKMCTCSQNKIHTTHFKMKHSFQIKWKTRRIQYQFYTIRRLISQRLHFYREINTRALKPYQCTIIIKLIHFLRKPPRLLRAAGLKPLYFRASEIERHSKVPSQRFKLFFKMSILPTHIHTYWANEARFGV